MKKFGLIWIVVIAGLIGCSSGPVEKQVTRKTSAEEQSVAEKSLKTTAKEKTESGTVVEKAEEEVAEKKEEKKAEFEGDPIRIGIRRFSITNPEKELQGLGDDIPQTITETLVRSPYAAPLEREEFNTLVEELKLSNSGMTDEQASLKAGEMLGATYIMLGAFIKLGDQIKINARLVVTETGEIGFADSVRGGEDEIFDLPVRLAEKMESFITEKAVEAQ